MNTRKKGIKENMKNMKTGTYFYNDESHNFEFATNLSANDKRIFVRTVVDTLVDDIYYDSVIRDIIFDYTTILMFTDVDTSFLKIVNEYDEVITNMELLEQFLEETNIVEVVKANAFPTLFDELNKAVDKFIEYRTGIHLSPINDALASLIKTFEKKIEEIDTNSMMKMAKKFANMTGDLTADNIVKAYIDSDLHKKNLEEIADSKKNEIKIDESLGEAIRAVIKENKTEKAEVVED